MAEPTRRRFLQIAGATAGFSALSGSIARAAAIPARRRTGTIKDVEHIVVLMQENRSFDHYFGTMRGVRGFGDPRPVLLPGGASVFHQPDGAGGEVLPYHPDAGDLGMQFIEGLNHEWTGSHAAVHDGRYDRWVPAKSPATMAYLTREDIPFHYALADAFTVCDAYHCSFIGGTDPNRYYMWSGWTGNDGRGAGPVVDNSELGYSWTTYPERLERAGISWKVYQDVGDGLDAAHSWGWIQDAYRGNYGDNSLLYFDNYRNARPGDPLYEKARTGTNAAAGDGLFDVLRADVTAGRLPQVSWIAAPEAFSEHPNWPANYGAWYVSQVLDALTSDPDVWSRTALFLTYDENDGYFDHVVPPFAPPGPGRGASTVSTELELFPGNGTYAAGPYGLGQRVPMTVVSPWSTGGYVCSEVFDHTSLIRFMERRFGVHEPQISPWRRAVCGDLTSAFDFSLARERPVPLPATDGYRPKDGDRHDGYVPVPPADQRLPVQERGSRPTRPLPYAPLVDAAVSPGKGTVSLTFFAGAGAGACFHVTDAGTGDAPRTYTASAGRTVSGTWDTAEGDGSYDLAAYGPAGFLRAFRGSAAQAGPEVTARHQAATGRVELTLVNNGRSDVRLTVRNSYDGQHAVYTLRPGHRETHAVDLARSRRWYDLTVTADHDPAFLRRLAGHVENGRPGVSDPALATA
ncbi:phosphocholine-specific phospholipase C [Streptomyces sp. NPDC020983]|uniref:phosphocholine-specific phospholipase C n=1 Tax=Streptomyces sp. NPDC020983 TaxID=3365106 RepID=UPI00378796F0